MPFRSLARSKNGRGVSCPSCGVEVIGDTGADVGLGESARSLIRAMRAVHLPVKITEIVTHPAQRADEAADDFRYLHKNPDYVLVHLNGDSTFDMALRQTKGAFLSRPHVMGYWYWELPVYPEKWLHRACHLDEIWVASSYVQQNLSNQVSIPVVRLPPPIEVVPACADKEFFGLPPDRFVFGFTFNPTSSVARKNPFAVVEAFRKAFGNRRGKPLLVLKTHHLNLLEEGSELEEGLKEALVSVGGVLLTDNWDRRTMGKFLCSCDAYVSLHRAEGLGLGIAESMVYGKPVIATAYSGNMDFMNVGNSHPVAYDMCEIQPDEHRYQPAFLDIYNVGQKWADPDLDHAAYCMGRVVDCPEETKEKARRARRTIEESYSSVVCGEAIRRRMEVLAGPSPGKERWI